jgi:hypothetical protein
MLNDLQWLCRRVFSAPATSALSGSSILAPRGKTAECRRSIPSHPTNLLLKHTSLLLKVAQQQTATAAA